MGKEDVMVSVGIDLDSLKKSLATVQAEMAKAFGDSGKAAGAFGVVINNITKATNASTNATKEKIDALKLEAQAHKTAGDAAKAEAAANVAASKSMEAAAKAQGAADVAAHRASAEAVKAQGAAYTSAFGAQQAQHRAATAAAQQQQAQTKAATAAAVGQHQAAAAAAKAHTAQINAQTAAIRRQRLLQNQNAGGGLRPGVGSGPKNVAGNIAMQIQDIAVTAQSGMSFAQIAGQQGSQLLSVFGPGGALAGGILAIGAAFATAFGRASANIGIVQKQSNELIESYNSAISLNTFDSLGGFISNATEKLKGFNEQLENSKKAGLLERWMNVLKIPTLGFTGIIGGNLEAGRQIETQKIEQEILQLKLKTINASNYTLDIGDKELEILRAKAAGHESIAEKMKAELDLQREIDAVWESDAAKLSVAYAEERVNQLREEYQLKLKIKDAEYDKRRAEEEDKKNKEKLAAIEKERKKTAEENADRMKEIGDAASREADEVAGKRESAEKRFRDAIEENKEVSEKTLSLQERLVVEKKKEADAAAEAARHNRGTKEFYEAAEKAVRARNEQIKIGKKIQDNDKREEKEKADDLEEQELRLQELAIERSGKGKSAIEIAKIELEFREKIKDALEKENHALAQKLAKERDILKHEEAINEQLKSPEQKKKERDEQKEREKAERIVRSRERRKAQAAQQAGFGGFVDDKGKPAKGVPNLQPNAPAAGAAGAAAGNAMKVDTLVVKVLKHG